MMNSDSRYQALLKAVPDLILVLSCHGEFLESTGGAEDTLALARSEFIGKNIADVFPGDFGTLALGFIHNALETGEVQVFEYQLPVPLGTDLVRDFEARVAPAGAETVVVIVRDLTDRKALEEENVVERQAEAKVEMLNHVSIALSHHLRNAITPIIGYAAAWQPIDPKGEALKTAIREQGKRITAVIQVIEKMAAAGDTSTDQIMGPGTPEMLHMDPAVTELLQDWKDYDNLRWPKAS